MSNDLNCYYFSQKSTDYETIEFNISNSLLNRLYYYLLRHNIIDIPIIYKKETAVDKLTKVDFDVEKDVIVVWGIHRIEMLNNICKYLPKKLKKYYWIWNTLPSDYQYCRQRLDKVASLGFEIATFDRGDASLYHLILKPQVFKYFELNTQICIKYDFYFLGLSKNRNDIISKLRQQLVDFKCKFIIPDSPQNVISYEENLQMIASSKCIIDIVKPEQQGLTLRPLEALFYKKKLITTYKAIKDYDFYTKENIFILGVDDMKNLRSFIESPVVEVRNSVKQQFNFDYWIKSFK